MAMDTSSPISRRALVGGTLAAVGAALASALGRPLRVAASNDNIIYTNDENNNAVVFASSLTNGPNTGAGIGVVGHSDGSVGVRGTSNTNTGVRGDSDSSYGVWAESASFTALGAFSGPGIGVYGRSDSNVGVRGESNTGRGGLFKGRKAQLRLVASAAVSHPNSGVLGDLFLDSNKRVWFCKGGTTWRQLA